MAKGTEPEGGGGAPKKGGGDAPAAAGKEGVVMRAPVHCDGCGRKLRRSLERLDWVGEVSVDSSTDTVVVRGPKVVENAAETVRIVERRTGGKAVLLSPAPEKLPPAAAAVKKETKKDDGDKDVNELPEINMKMVVILRMNLHCDACCEEMKRRILRIKGVEDAVPHLKSSQMMVKGVVEPATLVGFIRNCTGRKAAIFRAEPLEPLPPPPPKSSPPPPPAAADEAAETKKEDTADTGEKKKDAQGKGKKEEEAPREEKKGGGGDQEAKPVDGAAAEEHEQHEEAQHHGEGGKHAAAGRLFAAPLPAGVFTVAPPEMTTMAFGNNVTPYHHYSYYPSSSSYYPYAYSPYYQCQHPQPYYPPYMYGYYPQPPGAFAEENPNSCAIV